MARLCQHLGPDAAPCPSPPAGGLPYPPHAFPGARDVETEYGAIRVFEWGAEDGDKVLLMHGIGTPCVALGDMANEFVSRGCRVMLFDFFGRGYSDAPADVPYDDRLYTAQMLLVIASSPPSPPLLPHTARTPALLHSHLPRRARRRRRVDFDEVPLSAERADVKVGDVGWQLRSNGGFVGAYVSTIRNAPLYGQHDKVWRLLSEQLSKRRRRGQGHVPAGLEWGRICLVLAERDPIVVRDECVEDSRAVLGEIAISRGKEVADIALRVWGFKLRT